MALDLATLRARVGAGPSDGDLELALEAAIEAMDAMYGVAAPTTTAYLRPFGQWLDLGNLRAVGVHAVKEGDSDLEVDDWEIWPGGKYLRRLDSSGNGTDWTAMVEVTYTPLSLDAERERVILQAATHDVTHHFGLRGITVGPWSEQYESDPVAYAQTRIAILRSYRPALVSVW